MEMRGMHCSIHNVVCVLCAVKLEDKASRIYVRDRTSFSTISLTNWV